MRPFTVFLGVFQILVLFSVFSCDEERPLPPSNRPPEIEEVSISASEVEPGGSVEIRVTASDPDGDPLQYSYELAGGMVSDPGSSVTRWSVPQVGGVYTITVTVSDGEESAQESLTITVQDGATIAITDPREGEMKPRIFTTSGTCANVPAGCRIWLVVCPENESLWYPQELLSPCTDGRWSSETIIGREGDLDKGATFSLRAMIVEKDGSLGRKLQDAFVPAPRYLNPEPEHPDIKAHHEIYVIRDP